MNWGILADGWMLVVPVLVASRDAAPAAAALGVNFLRSLSILVRGDVLPAFETFGSRFSRLADLREDRRVIENAKALQELEAHDMEARERIQQAVHLASANHGSLRALGKPELEAMHLAHLENLLRELGRARGFKMGISRSYLRRFLRSFPPASDDLGDSEDPGRPRLS